MGEYCLVFTRRHVSCHWSPKILPGRRVVRVLDRLKETRGLPKAIVLDNGPEMRGLALDEWAYRNGVTLAFIDPGKPVQNAFVESFNGCAAASSAPSEMNASTRSWDRSLRDGSSTWRIPRR